MSNSYLQMATTAEQIAQDSYIDKLKTSIELIEAIKAENDMYKENFEQASRTNSSKGGVVVDIFSNPISIR